MRLEQFVDEIETIKDSLIRIALSKGTHRNDIDDSYQGFILHAIESRMHHKYNPERGEIEIFIGTCFNNYQRDEVSKKNAKKRAHHNTWELTEEDFYKSPRVENDNLIVDVVKDSLKLLNRFYGDVLEMKYFQRMEFSDIANELGIKVEAVRERALTAYRKIKNELRDDLLSLDINLRYKLS